MPSEPRIAGYSWPALAQVKRPVGRPKKVTTDILVEKAEEAKKQEKLGKVLDEMAEKRGDYE